jgi:hypothetical protein
VLLDTPGQTSLVSAQRDRRQLAGRAAGVGGGTQILEYRQTLGRRVYRFADDGGGRAQMPSMPPQS